MRKILLTILALFTIQVFSQVITTDPTFPTANNEVTLTFNAKGTSLEGITGDLYAHTGVNIDGQGIWKHVIESWGDNNTQPKLIKKETDLYELVISPSINDFYSIPSNEKVIELCIVFRSADASVQSDDLFVEVYEQSLSATIIKPESNILISGESQIEIEAASNLADMLTLYIDDDKIEETTTNNITKTITTASTGKHWIWVEAKNDTESVYDSVYYFIKEEITIAELPAGAHNGINYVDDKTVTLVLNAPEKEYVYLVGDFNDWDISNVLETKMAQTTGGQVTATTWMMNKTSDGNHFWLTLEDVTPNAEYSYQYLIDGEIKIADPYTEKVLDPWNDKYITDETYPGLISYPEGKTTEPVSVFQTAQENYNWEITDFVMPDVTDMVIYEMHIRDFVATHSYKTVADTLDYLQNLGVNVLELMPINEFEGNSSWGYNPSFYFAPDKYYGPKEELKRLVDECHKRGIAVVIDLVLNHSYGQSPLVRMYFENGKPASNNPWYNVNSNFSNPDAQWGYDFNHESLYTQQLVDSVNAFWMSQYKVDGFRFDFTKGFSNTPYGTSDWGSAYDADRIRLLKRMADEIWARKSNAYISFEHLSDNTEERELANYGINLWGNLNHNYNEGTMGYNENGKSDFSWISYIKRGWSDPHVVGYMESHDEERLMFKNLEYGNSNGAYNVTEFYTALNRIELAANFFLTIPGPKMIWQFGELGYEVSIDYNGRVGEKPIRWDYFEKGARKRIYEVMAYLNKLKVEEPAFKTSDFSLNVNGALKSIHLNHTDMNVVILGNFDVVEGSINPEFQNTGTWYEFYTSESVDISDTEAEITLKPGEYRLYTTKQLETPDINPSVNDSKSTVVKNGLNVYPNPVNSELFIQGDTKLLSIAIINVMGQQVYSRESPNDIRKVDVSLLDQGIYIITGSDKDGTVYSSRFIK